MAKMLKDELDKADEGWADRVKEDTHKYQGQGVPDTASLMANVDEKLSTYGIALLKVIAANNINIAIRLQEFRK
jgi:hypothetical protein